MVLTVKLKKKNREILISLEIYITLCPDQNKSEHI